MEPTFPFLVGCERFIGILRPRHLDKICMQIAARLRLKGYRRGLGEQKPCGINLAPVQRRMGLRELIARLVETLLQDAIWLLLLCRESEEITRS